MQELYKILGVSEDASLEEIESSYKALKAKYSKERFLEGEQGNQAAKNLTLLENAYQEIIALKRMGEDKDYKDIEKLIRNGDLASAQAKLDEVTTRDGNWHYLQSVVFYKKNWINESKKQLEIAMSKEPNNKRFSDAYTKLNEKIAYNQTQYNSGSATPPRQEEPQAQMGGTAMDGCCSWCATMCCMNMCLNMCCHC